jgi:hypothetical protein
MKWYSYSYSEPQAVSSTSTSTAQAEYEYDNALISGFGQHLVVAISEKCRDFPYFRVKVALSNSTTLAYQNFDFLS